MTRARVAAGLLVLAVALGTTTAPLAQRGPGMGPRMYDASTVETVEGVVTALDTVAHARRHHHHRGIHLRMRTTGDEELTVHLGPLFYLRRQNVALDVSDTITVRGSRVTGRNAPALVAAEVRAHGQTWSLRDDRGRPHWRGHGRGGPPNR